MKTILLSIVFLLAASAAQAANTLTWNDNSGKLGGCTSNPPGPCDQETNFVIQKMPSGGSSFSDYQTVGANVTTFVDATGVSGDCYRIYAKNSAGNSPFSNVACKSLIPGAPDGLQITLEFPLTFAGTFKNNRITAADKENGLKLAGIVGKKSVFSGTVTR